MKETLDFIIIGAQKAGTTSLFEYLRRHPQISMPDGKELPYFSSLEAQRRDWPRYLESAFARSPEQSRWGTATPQYMCGGLLDQPNPTHDGERHDERTVPERIRARLPEVRLVAVLRDPVERARSHHRMATMERLETRSFTEAVDQLLEPRALESARLEPRETSGYVSWGEYGRILAGYRDVFPREQLLVLFTEDLERDPEAALRRIFLFLDVGPDFVPENLGERYRQGASQRRVGWLGTYSALSPWAIQRAATRAAPLRALWHGLPQRHRRRIDGAFGDLAYRLDLWNRRTAEPGEATEAATLSRLREHFAIDHLTLEEMLGMSAPWHEQDAAPTAG
jgi:hypothetical protein